jgi:hypothetical protein
MTAATSPPAGRAVAPLGRAQAPRADQAMLLLADLAAELEAHGRAAVRVDGSVCAATGEPYLDLYPAKDPARRGDTVWVRDGCFEWGPDLAHTHPARRDQVRDAATAVLATLRRRPAGRPSHATTRVAGWRR